MKRMMVSLWGEGVAAVNCIGIDSSGRKVVCKGNGQGLHTQIYTEIIVACTKSEVYVMNLGTGVEVDVENASETWKFCSLILQFVSSKNSVNCIDVKPLY
jgi:hypothetical protein